jgi:hypothetical protein
MADERHPQCVHVVEDLRLAAALADWLTDKGFPAQAVTPNPAADAGDSLGISEQRHPGIEIRVVKPEHVEPARAAIAERIDEIAAIREKQTRRAQQTGTVTVVCDDCGKSSEWPAAAMGTTENCPHCSQYLDIPDPDDDWADVDFGNEEVEDDTKESG